MKAELSSSREKVLSVLRYTLLVPILIVSGCGYAPNLLPVGADEILTYPYVRDIASTVDYPIVVTVKKGQKDVSVRWEKRGKVIWGERPGNALVRWHFTLHAPGVDGFLCEIPWNTNTEKRDEVFPCSFDAYKYLGMPLVGVMDYHLGGEESQDPSPRNVSRVYYMVGQP